MISEGIVWNKYVRLTPGRIRLKVPGLKRNDYLSERILDALENTAGIDQVVINLLTGTMLVHYDENFILGQQIIICVDNHRQKYDYPAPFQEQFSPMITGRANKIFLIASALVLLSAKRKIFGPSALSSSIILNNTATVIGLIIGFPLFLWGLKHPHLTKRRGYDSAINAITFTLLFLEESLTGLLLMLFVNYSKIIMALDFIRTNQIIARVGKLPERVWVVNNETELAVPLDKLEKGDIVLVRSAEIIPIDGKVVDGAAVVDESQITGITKPINKKTGSRVFAGTEILDGTLKIIVEQTGSHTQLRKLIRSSVQKNNRLDEAIFQDRINLMIYISLIAAGGIYWLTGSLNRSLAILLAASPSAAALAVPAANGVAIGKALQRGIYVKDGKNLLRASQVDTLVLDKIPSLMQTETSIQEVIVINKDYSESDILRIAAAVEGIADNSLIEAIRARGYHTHFGPISAGGETEFIPKLGFRAKTKGKKILLGTKSLMLEEKVNIKRAENKVLRFRHLGLNPIFLSVDGKLCGLFGVRETIKPEVGNAINQLRALGIKKILLLTRDEPEAAEIAANQLGITEFYSGMVPRKKAELIKDLSNQGYKVVVLGDGVDDAPAMAEAKIGLAWGKKGADSAAKVAGIVVSAQNPQVLADTIFLAQMTREAAKQNINFAIGLNVIGMSLGAGGFISNVSAAFLGHLGIIVVIFNSYYQKWF